MILVTTPDIAGKKIVRSLGLVKGNTIRARHLGRDIAAKFRNIVGGEITDYTKMLAESREQSIDRMKKEAERLGANAITMVIYRPDEKGSRTTGGQRHHDGAFLDFFNDAECG